MQIYDISLTITGQMPVWPGDQRVSVERVDKIERGANANVSKIEMSAHTGTHVDAPYHFLPGGSKVDEMPLDILVGPALVVRIPDAIGLITHDVLDSAAIPQGTQRILLKTRNSEYWSTPGLPFQTEYVGIDVDAARLLVKRGVRLVGIDYLSVSPFHQTRPTHEALLEAGMVVIEGLDLSGVHPGSYTLCCLPLKLGGADGAPARAILMKD